MSKLFESNISQELNIKELTVVAKRIEKHKNIEGDLTKTKSDVRSLLSYMEVK